MRGRQEPGLRGTPKIGPSVADVVDALPRAIVVTDGEGRIVVWSRRAEELYGWTPDDVLGKRAPEVLAPIDAPDASWGQFAVPPVGEPFAGDLTVLNRAGEPVLVHCVVSSILDPAGSVQWIVAASEDISELRLAEQRNQDLTEHLQLALDAAALGTWRWDMTTGEVAWDERMEQLFGYEPGAFDGTFETYQASLHPDDRDATLAVVNDAVQRKSGYQIEHRVLLADGSERWIHGAGTVIVGTDGTVIGAIGCSADVTERVRSQLASEASAALAQRAADRERIDRERFEFLSAMTAALADAMTREDVMVAVTRAAVPRLGDWCSIFVLTDGGGGEPMVETFHADPEMVDFARELTNRFPFDPDAATGMAAVIRTGQSEFIPEITPAVVDDTLSQLDFDDAAAEELRRVLDRLSLRSSIAVPLVKHGRVLGGLSFATTTDQRAFTQQDLALAHVVAGRVAASLENRRLADQQREIASTLQASLLPGELPDVPGLEIAARYWPAGEGTVVGGDFYDVFETGPDRWVVVIGDVCGTGPRAAALTSMARHTIRQAAWRGDPPEDVLVWLNRSMNATVAPYASFLTIAYLTLERRSEGYAITVTTAGHPAPVHVTSTGTGRGLGEPGRVIGMFESTRTRTVQDVIAPGDTIVLYTDGLTDLPPPYDLDPAQTIQLITRAVSEARDGADDVAARLQRAVEDRRLLQDRADDIAIVVLHAT